MDNSFKKIISGGLASLSEIFKSNKSNSEALGIDIGSSAIKIVQLKKKGGKAILETYGVLSLGPYSNSDLGVVTNLKTEDIAKALVDVIKESNVTIKSATIAIPSLSSLIFVLTLPGNNIANSELEKIIPIEARKYIPVPISEVTLNWFVIPQEESSYEGEKMKENQSQGKTEVFVVAINNETVSKYQDIIKKTDLQAESFEMEIFSGIRSSINNDTAPVLLIDFGASKTKVSIVEAGVVRVFHAINRGSQDITRNISQSLSVSFKEAENLKRSVGLNAKVDPKVENIIRLSVNYIFSETNSIVFNYEKKYNKKVSKIVLVGGGSLLNGLLDATKENFQIEVIYSNPFGKTEAPAFLRPVLEINGPEFAVAVGLAIRQLT